MTLWLSGEPSLPFGLLVLSLCYYVLFKYLPIIMLYNMLIQFIPTLESNFHIVKLGLQGYTLFSYFFLKSMDYGYSLELLSKIKKKYHKFVIQENV